MAISSGNGEFLVRRIQADSFVNALSRLPERQAYRCCSLSACTGWHEGRMSPPASGCLNDYALPPPLVPNIEYLERNELGESVSLFIVSAFRSIDCQTEIARRMLEQGYKARPVP